MATEAFYSTASQVLPTILIALSVEIGFMRQKKSADAATYYDISQRQVQSRVDPRSAGEWSRQLSQSVRRLHLAFEWLCVTFVVGELTAVLSVAFGWFNAWTLGLVVACAVVMIVAAAVVPLMSQNSLDL
ncbi:hypothetical protein [Nonomuraea jabiensis]|uniref:Putative membrane protein n=1 Tax=Nonomuraea jabiensis TaxID=882448 RepID=A0A7W9GDQ1_9ACTN|nr:hypothetical protein [Nonomuraea jabiensis]MBB5781793.1 putative membrane protein [Nonomuraea jabiensis]